MAASSTSSPCAACKFLRRKCQPECVFAPYFPPDQPQKFANVHKVFGASNVTKLLNELHPRQREDAVNSLAYEADMRLRDPVYGCVGVISLLQHQLRQLQIDLSFAKSELSEFNNFGITSHPQNQLGINFIGSNGRDIQSYCGRFFPRGHRPMNDATNSAYDSSPLSMNVSASIGQLNQFHPPRAAAGDDCSSTFEHC